MLRYPLVSKILIRQITRHSCNRCRACQVGDFDKIPVNDALDQRMTSLQTRVVLLHQAYWSVLNKQITMSTPWL